MQQPAALHLSCELETAQCEENPVLAVDVNSSRSAHVQVSHQLVNQ